MLEKNVCFFISMFLFHNLPHRGEKSICVEAQDEKKKSITPVTGSTGLSSWLFKLSVVSLAAVLVYFGPFRWLQLSSCRHMEGAEFNIGVDNLWALAIVHHPHAIKPEKKLWISSATMWKSPSSPHLAFSRLTFPRPECSQSAAREREAIFHSLKHSFDFGSTVSKIFPLWVFPLPPHVTVSFYTKLQRAEKPWPHSHPNNEKAQMGVSACTFLNLTLHWKRKKTV